VDAPLFGDLATVKREIDSQAMSRFFTVVPDVIKVGAEGYIHGWICVRPPCGKAGDKITHADHGNGKITSVDGEGKHAEFEDGHKAVLGREDDKVQPADIIRGTAASYNTKTRSLDYNPDFTVDGDPAGTVTYRYKGKVIGHAKTMSGSGKERQRYVTDVDGNHIQEYAGREFFADSTAMDSLAAAHNRAARKLKIKPGELSYDDIAADFKKKAKLTERQQESVNDYVENSLSVNDGLRGVTTTGVAQSTFTDKDRAKLAASLDKITAKYSLPAPATLYRGGTFTLPENPVGSVITDKAFVSTSLDEAEARKFIDSVYDSKAPSGSHRYLMRIAAPAGTHGAVLNSDEDDLADVQEFLLPRNTSFKITRVSPDPDDPDNKIIDVTIVPGEAS
jgi:hypothetical protein